MEVLEKLKLESKCSACDGSGVAARPAGSMGFDLPKCEACGGCGGHPTAEGRQLLEFLRRHWERWKAR